MRMVTLSLQTLEFLMKINQLFSKKVECDVLMRLLSCFGISDLHDKRFFCKFDLLYNNTLCQLERMRLELQNFYLPCKAKIYLEDMNEKRAITVLKQILRLHGYFLQSREKNINTRKVIFYQIVNEVDRAAVQNMRKHNITNIIHFD